MPLSAGQIRVLKIVGGALACGALGIAVVTGVVGTDDATQAARLILTLILGLASGVIFWTVGR